MAEVYRVPLPTQSNAGAEQGTGLQLSSHLNQKRRITMKTVMRISASTALMVILCIGLSSLASAVEFPTGPVTSSALPQPELGPVQPFNGKLGGQQTDLVVTSFGLTADGRMTYIVVNRGRTAANSPFVVDLIIDGKRKDTIKHNALPPLSQQLVISNLARPEVCIAVQLRIALDTQQLVNEADEANNTQVRQVVPPCPDLVVDIDKDSVHNGLRYRAKVQVTNRGNLTTKREFFVLLKGGGSGLAFAALPILKRERVGPLAPGQTMSFYESGDHLGTSTFTYWALADQLEEIRESNENNNSKGETMGGGH
jgi:hypothetical protein